MLYQVHSRDDARKPANEIKAQATEFDVAIDRVWWLQPIIASGLIVSVTFYVAATTGPKEYAVWLTKKYLDNHLIIHSLIGYGAFVVGILLAYWGSLLISSSPEEKKSQRRTIRMNRARVISCDQFAHQLFVLAVFGYVMWVGSATIQGAGFDDILRVMNLERGAVSNLRRLSTPIAGLTTLTQVAIVAVAIRLFLIRIGYPQRSWELFALVLLAIGRAFLYGERLALIEIGIPMLAIAALVPSTNKSTQLLKRYRWQLLPAVAIPIFWSVYAIFEYSRSWLYYRTVTDLTFIEYINQRLAGYYVTAINNGALYHLMTANFPHGSKYPFAALWNAPIVGAIIGTPKISGVPVESWWPQVLRQYANPEFNNPSTFLIVDADLGTLGAFVYWLTFGLIIGLVYAAIQKNSLTALIAYACSYVGILEIVRILYWADGRFAPVVVAIVVFGFKIRRTRFFKEEASYPISKTKSPIDSQEVSAKYA